MKVRTASLLVAGILLALSGVADGRPIPELTSKERAARIKALPEEDRKWLEEFVAPIILAEETNLFLQLTEPHQREIFREEFWRRREQPGSTPPLGPGYRNRYEHYRELAATEYGGLTSDPGRVVVLRGDPDSIQEFRDCNEVFRSVEVWTYSRASSASPLQGDIQFLFYRPSFGAPLKLWYPAIPDREIRSPPPA
jgi:GWxTD domain-containing protein